MIKLPWMMPNKEKRRLSYQCAGSCCSKHRRRKQRQPRSTCLLFCCIKNGVPPTDLTQGKIYFRNGVALQPLFLGILLFCVFACTFDTREIWILSQQCAVVKQSIIGEEMCRAFRLLYRENKKATPTSTYGSLILKWDSRSSAQYS